MQYKCSFYNGNDKPEWDINFWLRPQHNYLSLRPPGDDQDWSLNHADEFSTTRLDFFESSWLNTGPKIAQNLTIFGPVKCHFFSIGYFWVTFVGIWAIFYSNIWSLCNDVDVYFVRTGRAWGIPSKPRQRLLRRQAVDPRHGHRVPPPADPQLEHQLLRLLPHVHGLQVGPFETPTDDLCYGLLIS